MVWEVVGSAMVAYAAAAAEERRQFDMAIADARPFKTSHKAEKSLEQAAREHRQRMGAIHGETMRGAKVGTLLLLALAVTAAYGLAQLAGIA